MPVGSDEDPVEPEKSLSGKFRKLDLQSRASGKYFSNQVKKPRGRQKSLGDSMLKLEGKVWEDTISRVKRIIRDFSDGSRVKNLPANAGDRGLISDAGRFHMPQST